MKEHVEVYGEVRGELRGEGKCAEKVCAETTLTKNEKAKATTVTQFYS